MIGDVKASLIQNDFLSPHLRVAETNSVGFKHGHFL